MLARLDELAAGAGLPRFTGLRQIATTVSLLLSTFLVVAGVTRSTVIAVALGSLAAAWPFSWLRSRRQKRLARFREAWPDAISTLVAAVRSGVSLPEACVALLHRGPVGLASGFEAFATTYRATGSFDASIHRMRATFADPVADRIAIALVLANDVGGSDLVRLLRTLGDFTREDLRVRKEIQARWSWTVTAARVAAASPWIVLILMSSRPEAAAAYNSAGGAFVIAAGGITTLVGYRLMLRAGRLPEEHRLDT
jgi:tight adherence protein B